ncbi:F-box protein at2g27310 [Phtheirospermum japonicum]|uniref:F-box protein at2g27310 n=1 Tax=Phtheirospermum japonicum TaxID=374723 RepID=A0A830CZP9_9LAMI|nr:F-box protein at2g27310 [Phtheirospermum japonicum]
MVREISMQIEDVEGKILTGLDSLRILGLAMEGQRWKIDSQAEKGIYEMFKRTKVRLRERKERRERRLDMACMAAGVSIFIGMMWMFLLSRR